MAGGILGKAAAKALELLKKRAGKGAERTAKSADVDALGNFKGKIQKAIDEVDNPKGGFEADMIPKAEKKTKKKKKNNPNALETPGIDKGIDTETPQGIKDEIARLIGLQNKAGKGGTPGKKK